MNKDCSKILECISDYIDGELNPDLCKMIEKHIETCNECKCMIDRIKHTIEILHSLPKEKVPESVEKDLLEKLKRSICE